MKDCPAWEQNSELRALREDFIASLPARLTRIRPASLNGEADPETRAEIHRLAGVAGSYGFPTLSQIAAAWDDALDFPGVARACLSDGGTAGVVLAGALRRAILAALASRSDPDAIRAEPEVAEAIFVVESLAFGPSPGSF